jgi:hypothetical protein
VLTGAHESPDYLRGQGTCCSIARLAPEDAVVAAQDNQLGGMLSGAQCAGACVGQRLRKAYGVDAADRRLGCLPYV